MADGSPMPVDPTYEYEAPMFVDFSEPIPDDFGADTWFDIARESGIGYHAPIKAYSPSMDKDYDEEDVDEGGCLGSAAASPAVDAHARAESAAPSPVVDSALSPALRTSTTPVQQQEGNASEPTIAVPEESVEESVEEPIATEEATEHEAPATPQQESPAATEKAKPANLVTSWSKEGSNVASALEQLRAKSEAANNQKKKSKRTRSNSVSRATTTGGPTRTRSGSTRARSASVSRATKPAVKKTSASSTGTPRATTPSTPRVLTRACSSSIIKSSEELELEEIQRLKREAAKQRKLSRRSFNRLSGSVGYAPVRSTKPLTEPKEFNLHPSKAHSPATAAPSPPKHGMLLRSCSTKAHPADATVKAVKRPTITKPRPFNFRSRAKTGVAETRRNQPFIALAQQVEKFVNSTPPRYHKPAKKEDRYQRAAAAAGSVEKKRLTPTIPMSPHLTTKTRARHEHILSTEERDLEVIAKHSNFHAQPLKSEILDSQGDYGVPRIAKKPMTVPDDVQLHTETRASQRPAKMVEEEQSFEFSAQAVPSGLFEGVRGVPQRMAAPVTQPQSPAICKTNGMKRAALRAAKQRAELQDAELKRKRAFVAQPLPEKDSNAFQPLLDHKHTVPEPFEHLESEPKPMEVRAQLQAKQIELERQLRQFKAQPLPSDEPSVLPEVERRAPTKAVEPPLRSLSRHQKRLEELRTKRQAEEAEQAQLAEFHAQPAKVLDQPAFVLKKSTRGLTEITPFELNTETRAGGRRKFEKEKRKRAAVVEEEEDQRKLMRLAEEEKELMQLRRRIVHKAQPVPVYQTPSIFPSDKLLTEPHSPAFSERLRPRAPRSLRY